MNLEGKNIILTGGSLGIGKETAKSLINKGANVLVTGRSEERLIRTIKYTKSKIIEFDIGIWASLAAFIKKVIDFLKVCPSTG